METSVKVQGIIEPSLLECSTNKGVTPVHYPDNAIGTLTQCRHIGLPQDATSVHRVSPQYTKSHWILSRANSTVARICRLPHLLTHFRFFITLRSIEGKYHSLILFRLTPASGDNGQRDSNQIYVMESTCPHLGAEMSHAEIEECETSVVAVCPWHG